MAQVAGCLIVNGLPRNGATVKLWATGAFATPPQKNTPLPAGSPIASGTTDPSNGGDGAYRFQNVSNGEYYTSIEFNGLIEYDYHNLIAAQVRDLKATYGAVGDGITDDTTAVQAWANSISGSTSDVMQLDLVIPPGIYKITSTIQTPALGSNFRMLGTGYRSAIFQWAGPSGVPMFLFQDCRGGEFQDFACQGNAAASGRPSACIELRRTSAWTAGMAAPYETRFERLFLGGTSASATVTGLLFSANSPSGNDTNNDVASIIDVSCQNCASYGISINHSNSLWHNIIGGYMVNCGVAGITNCQATSGTQGGGFAAQNVRFTNCTTCYEIGRSYHAIHLTNTYAEGCSGFVNTPYTIVGTDSNAARTHVFINGGSVKMAVNTTTFTFDAGDKGHLTIAGLWIIAPAGAQVSFPSSGSWVEWFGGMGSINAISYNCNLTIWGFRQEGTSPTFTNLGKGKLRLYDSRESSTTAPHVKGYDGVQTSEPLVEIAASALSKFQPTSSNQNVLTLGMAYDASGNAKNTWSSGEDSMRIKVPGAGKRHGFLTYRPQDLQFYITGQGSAFDDGAVDLKVNGKMLPVNGIDVGASGSVMLACISASGTWDPPNVTSGNQTTTTIGLTGAAVGDAVSVGFSQDLQGMQLTGYVSSANTVTVVLRNGTGGGLDLASGTLRVVVTKF